MATSTFTPSKDLEKALKRLDIIREAIQNRFLKNQDVIGKYHTMSEYVGLHASFSKQMQKAMNLYKLQVEVA